MLENSNHAIFESMHIEVNLKNQSKLLYLVELLKSLDFVESVIIQSDKTQNRVPTKSNAVSFFDQFYGSTKSNMTVEQIDNQLDSLRSEWERTTQ